MKPRCLLLLIFLVVFTTGCLPKEVDRSFVTQTPCEPPCWYDLELGQSSEQDIMEVIGTLPFIDKDSVTVADVGYLHEGHEAQSIRYKCTYKVDALRCGDILVLDGKLASMWYGVGYDLTMKTVVDLYGPPTHTLQFLCLPKWRVRS